MIQSENCRQAADAIRRRSSFIVTAHVRADGDAIAAVIFVSEMLRALGKDVCALLDDPVIDPKYSFLKGFDSIRSLKDFTPSAKFDTAIVLDSPTLNRIGGVSPIVRDCPEIICIDHHPGNDGFAQINLIDVSASSTCEILTALSDTLMFDLPSGLANVLYTGLSFDTGNFRFSNTSGMALRTAARLVDLGANPEFVADRLFNRTTLLRTRAMAQVLQSIDLVLQRKVAISCLPYAFFSSHPGAERELEGFSDLAISIDGVSIAAFLKELDPGVFRISLRACEKWDVGSVAEHFGGGGHKKAAGCQIKGDYGSVIEKLLAVIHHVNPGIRRD